MNLMACSKLLLMSIESFILLKTLVRLLRCQLKGWTNQRRIRASQVSTVNSQFVLLNSEYYSFVVIINRFNTIMRGISLFI